MKTANIVRSKKKINMSTGRIVFIVLMLTIPFLKWAIFWLYVNINSIMLAFRDARTLKFSFNNFVEVWDSVTRNGELGLALKNTGIFFVSNNIFLFMLNLIMSYFLYKQIKGYKIFRIIFYLPVIISGVAMVTVYSEFIKPEGPLGFILKQFNINLPERGLLATDTTALPTIMFYCIWTGFTTNVIIFSSSLSRIPIDVLEYARIEGCGPVRELFNIIIPLIFPMISTMLIFSLTGLFGASGPILLFTNGEYNTTTISFWIFKQVYGSGAIGGSGSYGVVSAAGLCFTIIGFPIIIFVKWMIERVPTVEY